MDLDLVVIEQMEEVLINLKKNVTILNELYATHNLNSDEKV